MSGNQQSVREGFLRTSVCGQHEEETSVAELLVSELVTNAVHHGLPPVILSVSCTIKGIGVRVRDASGQVPVHKVAELDDESGRGVYLVDVLSDDWGVDLTGDDKVVWFRLNFEHSVEGDLSEVG